MIRAFTTADFFDKEIQFHSDYALLNLVHEMLVHMGCNSSVKAERLMRQAIWQWKGSHDGIWVTNMGELARLQLRSIDEAIAGHYDVYAGDEHNIARILEVEINGSGWLQQCDTETSASSRKVSFGPSEQGVRVNLSYMLNTSAERAIMGGGFEVTSFPFDRDVNDLLEQFDGIYKCRKEDYITIGAETDYIESVKRYLLLVVPSIARKVCRIRHCESCRFVEFGDSFYDAGEANACELCTKTYR